MSIGKLFKSLFGAGSDSAAAKVSGDPVNYNGFVIVAEPVHEGGQYRTAGTISKEIDGVQKQSRFIRADNNPDEQSAIDHCVLKAKQIIDEQGDRLFDREMV